MKRSTIILIIFLVLLIITPIVIVKTVNNLSPESKLKGIQTLWNKRIPIPLPDISLPKNISGATARHYNQYYDRCRF